MHEFSQDDLKKIASQSEKNVQIFWDMFGLGEVPQPKISPGVVWAVVTAAVNEGWVEIPGSASSILAPMAGIEGNKDSSSEGTPDERKEEAQIREDLYIAGYQRGVLSIKEKLASGRDDAEAGASGARLVTMSADNVTASTNGDGFDEAILGQVSENMNGGDSVDHTSTNATHACVAFTDDLDTSGSATHTPAQELTKVLTHPRVETSQQRQEALQQVIGDLREMATGNIMPTPDFWDANKQPGTETAEIIQMRFNLDWPTLAQYARLEMVNRRGRPPKK